MALYIRSCHGYQQPGLQEQNKTLSLALHSILGAGNNFKFHDLPALPRIWPSESPMYVALTTNMTRLGCLLSILASERNQHQDLPISCLQHLPVRCRKSDPRPYANSGNLRQLRLQLSRHNWRQQKLYSQMIIW